MGINSNTNHEYVDLGLFVKWATNSEKLKKLKLLKNVEISTFFNFGTGCTKIKN